MATEIIFANSISGQTTGAIGDIDEGISAADGNVCATSSDGEAEVFTVGFASVVDIVDADTVNSIIVRLRAGMTGPNGSYAVDFRIGGTIQGTQQDSGALTVAQANYNLSDAVGWDADYTAAQLNGADVLLTAAQAGMPDPQTWSVDTVEIEIDYTPAASSFDAAGTPTLPIITVGGAALATYAGAGTVVLPQSIVNGLANTVYNADGQPILPGLTISGLADTFYDSAGQIVLPSTTIGGVAAVPSDANGFWLPDPRWELWELMEGRKPTEPVVIDWEHPLTEGLVFFGLVIEGGLLDLVTGRLYSLPNAAIKPNSHGNLCAEYDGTNVDTLTTSIETSIFTSYIHDAEKVTAPAETDTVFEITSNSIILRLEWFYGSTREWFNWNSGQIGEGNPANSGILSPSVTGLSLDTTGGDSNGWLYVDGSIVASDLAVSQFGDTGEISQIVIGGRSASQEANCRFTFLAIFGTRTLSAADHFKFALSRHQFLIPA